MSEDSSEAGGGNDDRPRRRSRLPLVVAGVLVLVVAGAIVLWQVLGVRSRAAGQPVVVQVTKQTLTSTVGTTGTIEPAHEADLSFSSSGTVTSIKVSVGDPVHKGDKLASINDDSLKADVDSAKAARDASRETLTQLEDSGTATDAAIASAKADLKVKNGQLKQAKATLKAASLTAPFDGVVAAVNVSDGDTVGSGSTSPDSSSTSRSTSGSGQSNSGATGSTSDSGSSSSGSSDSSSSSAAITVINTSSWVVDATVGSADLPSIKKGQRALLTQTGSNRSVSGHVTSVGIMADGSNDFPVTISISGSPHGLYAGSSANVSIITRQIPDALTIPTVAVQSDGTQTYVMKVTGGRQVKTPITVGQTHGSKTVVTSGLAEGDRIVLPTTSLSRQVPNGGGGLFPGGRRRVVPGGALGQPPAGKGGR